MRTHQTVSFLTVVIAILTLTLAPLSQAQSPQQRVDSLKDSLASSQQSIKKYEWVQTVTVTVDGKTTKHDQMHCYYGVEGNLQKVPIGADGSSSKKKGFKIIPPPVRLLEKLKEDQAEELKAFAKKAEQLVQSYLPPDAKKIQAVVSAGKMSLSPAGQRVNLAFADYLQAGDKLGVEMELPTNRLISISVDTYVDKPEDAVQFNAQMGVLPDGTIYASHITLAAPSKKLNIVIDNTGHRPASG